MLSGSLFLALARTACSQSGRKIGASKEQARREQLAEQRANGGYDGTQDDEEEDYMEF